MIECAVTQDILKYKSKFIGNFSAREALWLVIGGLSCALSYFYILSGIEGTAKIYISAIIAVPFFCIGFIKPFGQPLEKILGQIIYDNFLCPAIRKNEIHFPEYEKFAKNKSLIEENNSNNESLVDENKKKKSKKKTQSNSKDKKIKKSKEFKAIR